LDVKFQIINIIIKTKISVNHNDKNNNDETNLGLEAGTLLGAEFLAARLVRSLLRRIQLRFHLQAQFDFTCTHNFGAMVYYGLDSVWGLGFGVLYEEFGIRD
jgi:hypothetical protein